MSSDTSARLSSILTRTKTTLSKKRIKKFSYAAPFLFFLQPAWAQQAQDLRIIANEFSFRPAKVQVSKGSIRITVTNQGNFPHGLAIVGRDEKISFVDSGETKTLTLKLDKEGEFVFYCPQPGHRANGMEGKLTVTMGQAP